MKKTLTNIATGLIIIEKWCSENVCISEHGDMLEVFHFDGSPILVQVQDDLKRLFAAGWTYDRENGSWRCFLTV